MHIIHLVYNLWLQWHCYRKYAMTITICNYHSHHISDITSKIQNYENVSGRMTNNEMIQWQFISSLIMTYKLKNSSPNEMKAFRYIRICDTIATNVFDGDNTRMQLLALYAIYCCVPGFKTYKSLGMFFGRPDYHYDFAVWLYYSP